MDYNIYIHNVNGSAEDIAPTKAWTSNESVPTKAWTPSTSDAKEGESFKMSAPPTAAFGAIKQAIKKHPVIAAAVAIIMITKKVIDGVEKVSEIQASDTGDYRFTTTMQNLQANMNILTHPISSAINMWNAGRMNKIYNRKQEQERMLLGDTFVNSQTRRM